MFLRLNQAVEELVVEGIKIDTKDILKIGIKYLKILRDLDLSQNTKCKRHLE